jgi:hypothetical protein
VPRPKLSKLELRILEAHLRKSLDSRHSRTLPRTAPCVNTSARCVSEIRSHEFAHVGVHRNCRGIRIATLRPC